jgi:FkbM family methyltransferase
VLPFETFQVKVDIREHLGGNLFYGLTILDPAEISFLKHILRDGDYVIDVGANIGLYSLLAAQSIGSKGRVYAFEPSSKAAALLDDNIRLNGFTTIDVQHMAVSDSASMLPLYVNAQSGLTSCVQNRTRGTIIGEETVPAIALDDFIAQRHIPKVNFLKIDVEGFEEQVLLGAVHLIAREQDIVIVVELDPKNYPVPKPPFQEIFSSLRSQHYNAFLLNRRTRQLESIRSFPNSSTDVNFVFSRGNRLKSGVTIDL